MSEREADLIKRLKRLEGVVQDLSTQVEIETLRQHSPSSENSSANKDTDSIDSKTHIVRVVGMDEGSRGSWLAKGFRIGGGPPKQVFLEQRFLSQEPRQCLGSWTDYSRSTIYYMKEVN